MSPSPPAVGDEKDGEARGAGSASQRKTMLKESRKREALQRSPDQKGVGTNEPPRSVADEDRKKDPGDAMPEPALAEAAVSESAAPAPSPEGVKGHADEGTAQRRSRRRGAPKPVTVEKFAIAGDASPEAREQRRMAVSTDDAAAKPSSEPEVELRWRDGILIGIAIRGVLDGDASAFPGKVLRAFKVQQGDDSLVLTADPSAYVGSGKFSESGAPVQLDLKADPSGDGGQQLPSEIKVKLAWHDGMLAGVRLGGPFLNLPSSDQRSTYRVFRVHQRPDDLVLTLDPTGAPAKAEFSETGAPAKVEFNPGTPARLGISFDWQDGTLAGVRLQGDFPHRVDPDASRVRRVFRLHHRQSDVQLGIEPELVSARAEFNDVGIPTRIELDRDILPDSAELAEARRRQRDTVYWSKRGDQSVVLKGVAVPYYYLTGVEKKLDIRDEWNGAFRTAAESVLESRSTFLSHDRLYTLWQAVGNIAHLKSPVIEVGVLRGGSSALIAKAQRHFGKTGTIFSCDTFTGHAVVEDGKDAEHKVGGFSKEADLQQVQSYLEPYPEIRIVVGNVIETASSVLGKRVSMMHLDADVYPVTKFCLEEVFPRLDRDGVVVVDDYGFVTCPGVKLAVDEFVAANRNVAMMHLLTGQALLSRKDVRA